MLLLLGLFCFAESLTIGGVEFDDVVQTYDPNIDTEDAAVFVVSKNGKLISTGKLRPKGQTEQPPVSIVPAPTKNSPIDFTQVKIPTQLWDGRQISIQQIEIFGTQQCPYCRYAKKLAEKKYGKEILKDHEIDDDFALRKKSDAILAAAGKSNFNTVPRISVIDNNNMRWFIGGFSDFQNFVQTNRSTPITPQTVDVDQASAANNYAELPVPTKRNLGLPIPADQIIQLEIFGAPDCPACVTAKALASNTFGAYRVKTYDIRKFAKYLKISNNILRSVVWQDTSMPVFQ